MNTRNLLKLFILAIRVGNSISNLLSSIGAQLNGIMIVAVVLFYKQVSQESLITT